MSRNINKNRFYKLILITSIIVLITSLIISLICVSLSYFNVIDENFLIIKKVCGFIVLAYFLVKICMLIFGINKSNPDCNFIIDQIWNINLLFAVITLMKTFYWNNENIYMSLYCASIIVVIASTGFSIYNLYSYSKNGITIIACLFLTLFLGLLNEESQTIITIVTTLISTVFGRTVLKNIFKSQIVEFEKDKKMKQDVIIDKLEYNLAMINIIIIFAQIIIWLTNFLNCIDFIEDLKCLDKYIIMGIIRFMILAMTYILFLAKSGKKLKERLFGFLIRSK